MPAACRCCSPPWTSRAASRAAASSWALGELKASIAIPEIRKRYADLRHEQASGRGGELSGQAGAGVVATYARLESNERPEAGFRDRIISEEMILEAIGKMDADAAMEFYLDAAGGSSTARLGAARRFAAVSPPLQGKALSALRSLATDQSNPGISAATAVSLTLLGDRSGEETILTMLQDKTK